MRRITAVLLALCAVFLCACGAEAPKTSSSGFANPDAFLKDMAAGITQRLNDKEDSSTMTAEEVAAYYLKLVGYELDRIEKYQDSSFEDKDFNELVHIYINACQTQRYAAQSYKNKALYDSLWSGGRTTRAAVITELYSRYGLPITSEQAASYAPASSYTVTVSSGGTNKKTDYTDCVSVKELSSMWNEHYINADYYHNDLAVTNKKADCDINVTMSAVFYDSKGSVVGNDRKTINALAKGETKYCSLRTDVPFSRAEYKIEQAEESHLRSGFGLLTYHVTTPNGKIMVEAKNKGNETVSWCTVYCVFYNGKEIVDVDSSYFATNSDPIEPGETQYGECSTRKTYTSYELYYDTWDSK